MASYSVRRRGLIVGVAAAFVIVSAVVLIWFQPQKLFIDDKVDEVSPLATAAQGTKPSTSSEPAGMATVARGEIRGLAHTSSGQAMVFRLEDGRRILRLEDFRTDNGPDLRVYLSNAPSSASEDAFGEDFVDLGKLKGNIGSQNYEIPAGVDLAKYQSAVVWCRRFRVGFAVAPLRP